MITLLHLKIMASYKIFCMQYTLATRMSSKITGIHLRKITYEM